jgi:hypothetical protein
VGFPFEKLYFEVRLFVTTLPLGKKRRVNCSITDERSTQETLQTNVGIAVKGQIVLIVTCAHHHKGTTTTTAASRASTTSVSSRSLSQAK